MAVLYYNIYYIYGLQQAAGVTETTETQFELSNLGPHIYTFSAISAVYQGTTGPQVCVGMSTGNLCLCNFIYLHVI